MYSFDAFFPQGAKKFEQTLFCIHSIFATAAAALTLGTFERKSANISRKS